MLTEVLDELEPISGSEPEAVAKARQIIAADQVALKDYLCHVDDGNGWALEVALLPEQAAVGVDLARCAAWLADVPECRPIVQRMEAMGADVSAVLGSGDEVPEQVHPLYRELWLVGLQALMRDAYARLLAVARDYSSHPLMLPFESAQSARLSGRHPINLRLHARFAMAVHFELQDLLATWDWLQEN